MQAIEASDFGGPSSRHPLLENELAKMRQRSVSPVVPPAGSPLGLPRALAELRAELGLVHAGEAKLRADNDLLRQELGHWRAAGERVARRTGEASSPRIAKAVAPAQTLGGQRGGPGASVPKATALAQTVLPQPSASPPSFSVWQLLVLLVGVLGLLGALQFNAIAAKIGIRDVGLGAHPKSLEGPADWRDRVLTSCKRLNSSPTLVSALRLAGIGSYRLQLTDIHVGGLPVDRRLYLRLRDARGAAQYTGIVRVSAEGFLRFAEALVVHVRRSERACTMCLIDACLNESSEEIELSIAELIRLAHRRRQRFFRARLGLGELIADAGQQARPFIAMKVHDVTPPGLAESWDATEPTAAAP